MREREIEKYLRERIETAGGMCLKFTSPGRRHVPDRIVLMPHGVVVFVEVKRPGEMPREGQLREHERLRALGANVAVLDSKPTVDLFVAMAVRDSALRGRRQ